MPDKFTCRLHDVPTPDGKHRLEYGPLDDVRERILIIEGPQIVIPPKGAMTDEESERWKKEMAAAGYVCCYWAVQENAPLVEANRTYWDRIPKNAVQAELAWFKNEAGNTSIGVRVTNNWSRKIPEFSVVAASTYDAAQPVNLGKLQSMTGGQWFGFVRDRLPGNDLAQRVPVGYRLPPDFFQAIQSWVASMSPECYWIALQTDGEEFDRVPGQDVADFLDSDGGP